MRMRAFVSAIEPFKAAWQNRLKLPFKFLVSAMMIIVCAYIVVAEMTGNRLHGDGLSAIDRKGCRLSGRVTMHGAPLNHGQIQFSCQTTPTEYGDTFETLGVCVPIVEGEYSLQETHALPPGLYLVTIRTGDEPSRRAHSFPVWCGPARKAVRLGIGRHLLIEITDPDCRTLDFELVAEAPVNFVDIH